MNRVGGKLHYCEWCLPLWWRLKCLSVRDKWYFVHLAMEHHRSDRRQNFSILSPLLWSMFGQSPRFQWTNIPMRSLHLYYKIRKWKSKLEKWGFISLISICFYLNKRSSISGNERYSSSTKSTNDERVVFRTRKFFNPLMIVGFISGKSKGRKRTKIYQWKGKKAKVWRKIDEVTKKNNYGHVS